MHLKKIKKLFFLFIILQNFSFTYASEYNYGKVIIKNKSLLFNVEIADTKKERKGIDV